MKYRQSYLREEFNIYDEIDIFEDLEIHDDDEPLREQEDQWRVPYLHFGKCPSGTQFFHTIAPMRAGLKVLMRWTNRQKIKQKKIIKITKRQIFWLSGRKKEKIQDTSCWYCRYKSSDRLIARVNGHKGHRSGSRKSCRSYRGRHRRIWYEIQRKAKQFV